MNQELAVFLLSLMFRLSALLCSICLLLFGLDIFISTWQRRRAVRHSLHATLAAIETERQASVRRLASAYAVAQQQIRNVSPGEAGRR